jgi:thioredoxin 1
MNSTVQWLLCVTGGAGIGAVWGYFNRCRTGVCPLTANWRRGALYGTVLAALLYSAAGCGNNSTAMNQSTANVKHITDVDFDTEVTQSALPVVADFYATWCGPCRQLAPIMDTLADQYAGKIKFVKVNVDESPKLAQQFQAEAIPMLVFIKSGRETDKLVGLQSKADLIERLDSLLQTNIPPTMPGQ